MKRTGSNHPILSILRGLFPQNEVPSTTSFRFESFRQVQGSKNRKSADLVRIYSSHNKEYGGEVDESILLARKNSILRPDTLETPIYLRRSLFACCIQKTSIGVAWWIHVFIGRSSMRTDQWILMLYKFHQVFWASSEIWMGHIWDTPYRGPSLS